MEIAGLFKFARNLKIAYDAQFKEMCEKRHMAQNAVYILLFLANNPEYNTAKDISKLCLIKPSLISFHVDNLVKDGYIKRERDENDRRKIYLECTKKADDIINEGKQIQNQFLDKVSEGLTPELRQSYREISNIIEANVQRIKEE